MSNLEKKEVKMAKIKPEDTLTGKDIKEIPDLLEDFSRRVPEMKKNFIRPDSRILYFLGRGSSSNATLFAKYIFEEYTGTICSFVRPHSIFEARQPLNFKNSAVWAYSQSGKSPDIVECLKKLISWGAEGVAVTNEADLSKNPLAQTAGRHILLSKSPELPVAATKSFILQLWTALWVAHCWSGCFDEDYFKETIDIIREAVGMDFSLVGRDYLENLLNAGMIGFVGRGTYNAVAADSALKFREMCRSHAVGYSAADFLHGPVGAYSEKDFVFLLSPHAELAEDLMRVRQALDLRGVKYAVLHEPKGKSPFTRLVMDIRLKITAINLSLAKGLNPDAPKGLAKVTETM